MNFFGKFAYGNIIKTFIPGIFIVFAFALLIDDYNFWVSQSYLIFEFSGSHPILTVGLIIPFSIFMGIVSNSLCFKWIVPKFIEQPFKDNNQDFLAYKDSIIDEMKRHYAVILEIPKDILVGFGTHMDIRSFLLNRKNLNTLQYLRESYWYYMEFQINSIIAISLLTVATVINILLRYNVDLTKGSSVFPYTAVIFLSNYILFKLLISAAKENYEKHEKKSLSYLQGAYHVCRYGSPLQDSR